MTRPDDPRFATFEREALAEGFDEVLERRWDPLAVLGTHTHPFDVKAVVVDGEMWLGCRGHTRHLLPGDTFELVRDEPHDERYGATGAVYWVARRSQAQP